MRVEVHEKTRVFRRTELDRLRRALRGVRFRQSWAKGKQMLFRFGSDAWIGLHLGMTGQLRTEHLPFQPLKHDHLVIKLERLALVFADARQFGRVRFDEGVSMPEWWTKIPVGPTERGFSEVVVRDFLARHRKLPIKAALLLQTGFPGIGNWMADEILWQSGILPARRAGDLSRVEVRCLWQIVRSVSRTAMRTIGKNFGDPPVDWLFHQRWSRRGVCPCHKSTLKCDAIGGRTTVWCPKCQK
jgi:formamidopyrimidine-DNA glycosylase